MRRLLLDTHTLMWWTGESKQLPAKMRSLIAERTSEVFISVVSAWDMQIKAQIGKLTMHKPWSEVVHSQIMTNGFRLLDVELSQIEVLDTIPFHHKDPFDRLLIAQAMHEGLTLISDDAKFSAYPVSLLW